jgi:hypothetical protein
MKFLRQHPQGFLQLSAAHPLLKTPMAGLIGRILRRQLPPLGPGAQNPQRPVQDCARILRRPSAPIAPPPKPQKRFQDRPLLIRHFSACSHPPLGRLPVPLSLSRYPAETTRENAPQPFMRLVLVCSRCTYTQRNARPPSFWLGNRAKKRRVAPTCPRRSSPTWRPACTCASSLMARAI